MIWGNSSPHSPRRLESDQTRGLESGVESVPVNIGKIGQTPSEPLEFNSL